MSPIRLERIESAMRAVIEFAEAFNRHDPEGMVHLISDDCVLDKAAPRPDGALLVGRNQIAGFLKEVHRESPQATMEVEEVFGMGSRCVLRWKYRMADSEGDGLRGVDLFTVRNGLICEILIYTKG
jgi:ketosteroid isomerase-like protein